LAEVLGKTRSFSGYLYKPLFIVDVEIDLASGIENTPHSRAYV
jgi:hypothetical protein